jgi:mono/diheme cytochrome c family protein
MTHRLLTLVALVCLLVTTANSILVAQNPSPAPPREGPLAADAPGHEIYRQACAACHGGDGTGQPQSVVGFQLPLPNGHDLPDFTDCATNTVEPMADWLAVVHRGGPVRALDRRMPAFGEALTESQIELALRHIWTFCDDSSWPRGDLNLPRTFFTEKAFPENETVWTTGVTSSGTKAVANELVYERRIGSRAQYEIKLPILAQQTDAGGGTWHHGIGDVEIALKRAFYANLQRGSIFSAGGAVVIPTGNEEQGLGNGFWIYEPFAMWNQFVGRNGFVQVHTGIEIPSDGTLGSKEGFVRSAFGYTFAQDQGFGRAWTPMVEVLTALPEDGNAEWDVVPQVQISLSKLQHVLLNVGVRVPLNEREDRKPEVLTYVLWDWFDGGLFDFWR